MIGLYVHARKPQSVGYIGDRTQSRDAACCVSTGGPMPGRLRASIALPGFGYQTSGLECPQWNGDKNKNKKDQAKNRDPLPSGVERRDLIPRTGIGAPHEEN